MPGGNNFDAIIREAMDPVQRYDPTQRVMDDSSGVNVETGDETHSGLQGEDLRQSTMRRMRMESRMDYESEQGIRDALIVLRAMKEREEAGRK